MRAKVRQCTVREMGELLLWPDTVGIHGALALAQLLWVLRQKLANGRGRYASRRHTAYHARDATHVVPVPVRDDDGVQPRAARLLHAPLQLSQVPLRLPISAVQQQATLAAADEVRARACMV
jgi:hypothetical protein